MYEKEVDGLNIAGNRLRELRKERNLNQTQLGIELGISNSTVRMVEIGKRKGSVTLLKKFADYFDVSLDYIQGQTDYRNSREVATDLVNALQENNLLKEDIDLKNLKNLINEYINKKSI